MEMAMGVAGLQGVDQETMLNSRYRPSRDLRVGGINLNVGITRDT